MRKFFLAVPMLAVCAIAGCVWPPDSTYSGYNNNYYQYYSGFNVHRISQRSLAGVEHLATIVSPQINPTGYYNSSYYPDSIRYIIVNGDTAYRHTVYLLPATYDSSVVYHIDGTANFITLVYPTFSVSDTTFESNVSAQITSPAYGDTISRSIDAMFTVQAYTSSNYGYPSGSMTITDSISFYTEPLEYGNTGTIDFPVNDLTTLVPGTLWADLYVNAVPSTNDGAFRTSGPPYLQFYLSHQVVLDRIVAYPLK